MLLAVLVYVTLDLSLPSMPGAFVFEAADSVESAQTHRWRVSGDVAPLAPPRPDPLATLPQTDDGNVPKSPAPVRPTSNDVVRGRPRAALTAPLPSEDPQ